MLKKCKSLVIKYTHHNFYSFLMDSKVGNRLFFLLNRNLKTWIRLSGEEQPRPSGAGNRLWVLNRFRIIEIPSHILFLSAT